MLPPTRGATRACELQKGIPMLRRTLLAGLPASFATCALLAAAPALAQQTKWNLPAAYSNSNYHTENLVQFAKDVEAATGGKLSITVHGNASLFKAPDIKKAVVTGQAQMGEVLISNHENEEAVFGIDVVPFLATSFADSQKLWDVSKGAIEKKLEAQGLKVLFVVPWGPQGIYSGKELKTEVPLLQRRHHAHR
jgi:TRAP-type C4-dicarboxylate transport system substrate-binding protein